MTQNATLLIEFGDFKKKFPVTWEQLRIAEGEAIADEIFFPDSEEMEEIWNRNNSNGQQMPEMIVYLNTDPKVKCQVHFEEMAGDLWPSKTPEQAQKILKKPKIKK